MPLALPHATPPDPILIQVARSPPQEQIATCCRLIIAREDGADLRGAGQKMRTLRCHDESMLDYFTKCRVLVKKQQGRSTWLSRVRHPPQLVRLQRPNLLAGVERQALHDRRWRNAASTVKGLTDLDLNFPDHVGEDAAAVARRVGDLGLRSTASPCATTPIPAFKLGAFTNPDRAVRREAIDLTKRGIDARPRQGANLMTIWLGQDGFDYDFQVDYAQVWDGDRRHPRGRRARSRVPDHRIEYKPNEPRAYSLLPDAATTLLAIAGSRRAKPRRDPGLRPCRSMPTSSRPSRRL